MNFQTKLPEHIAAYLNLKLSVPATAGVTDTEKDRPFVSVFCNEWSAPHRRCWAGDVTVRLLSTSDRSREDDAVILSDIQAALRDHAAFDSYMLGLPKDQLAHWRMSKFQAASGNVEVDSGEAVRSFDIIVRCAVIHA